MFSRIYSGSIVLLLAIHVHGHALISPDLNGGTARADVTRPSNAAPCGVGVNVASLINTAQAVPVIAGNIDATITNFNGGTDGSRFVTAQIDPTGTGKNFQEATVTTNGDRNPTDVGSQPLVVQVPAGIQATGGTTGNRMLVAFKTLGGFGNCIAATTGNAAASNSTSTTTSNNIGTGKAATGKTTDTTATAVGAGKAAKGAGAAAHTGAKGSKTKGKKTKGVKAAAAKKAQRHREMQKLKLRNAVFESIDSESD